MREFKNHKLYITPRYLYIYNIKENKMLELPFVVPFGELKNITQIVDSQIRINGMWFSCREVVDIKNLDEMINGMSAKEEYSAFGINFTFRYPITIVRFYCRSLKRYRTYYTLNGRLEVYVRNARDIKITRRWKNRTMYADNFQVKLYETTDEEIENTINNMINNCNEILDYLSSSAAVLM